MPRARSVGASGIIRPLRLRSATFLVSVARSAIRVWKLWTGRPSGVRPVVFLVTAAGERSALATTEGRSAATKEIGNADRQEAGRRLNNRAENSHQPFRRRERAMQRFRSKKTLQRFSSVHAQVHFNQERHLVARQVYKQRRSAALAEWSALAA